MTSTPDQNIDPTRDQRGPEDDLVSEDPDLSVGDQPTVDEGPAAEAPDEDGLGMADAPAPDGSGADEDHPSQAEGEDPDDPADVDVQSADGHPSQADG
jgi:hypothetical protein